MIGEVKYEFNPLPMLSAYLGDLDYPKRHSWIAIMNDDRLAFFARENETAILLPCHVESLNGPHIIERWRFRPSELLIPIRHLA